MISDLASQVAFSAAERVRKNLGPRAALVPYRALAENAADSETRGRAVLEAVACAAEISDEPTAGTLVGLYTSVTRGALERRAREVVLALAAKGYLRVAAALAALELARHSRAVTAYLHGRCLDRLGDPGAGAALSTAERLAEEEGDVVVGRQARALRACVHHERGEAALGHALEKGLALRELPEPLVLRLAPHGLRASSRFTRAAWLAELEHVALGGVARRRALGLVCAHAEERGHGLTDLERDRVAALFAKLADTKLGASLLARLAAWKTLRPEASPSPEQVLAALGGAGARADELSTARRAIDLATGRFEPKSPLPLGSPVGLAFAAAGAVRDGDTKRAELALAALVSAASALAPLSRAPAWEAAYVALFLDDEGVRREAFAVLRALVATGAAPPRGALAVARAARAAGDEALAEALLSLAVAAKEPGAAAVYVEVARELAWRAALEGRRDDARRLLREAALVSR